MSKIAHAVKIAVNAHDGQMYGNNPYFYHPVSVASLVEKNGFPEDYVITAYLHDVVEDSSYKLEDIEYHFGPRIAEAVGAMSKRKDESYDEYLARVVANEIASVVKYFDVYHNHIISGRDTKKYRKAIAFLREKVWDGEAPSEV